MHEPQEIGETQRLAQRDAGSLNELADAVLVVAARQGTRQARDLLFVRHLTWTRRFAFRLLRSDADVNDVVQDSMLTALEAFDKLKDPAFFSSWLGGVVVNTVRGLRRKRRRAAARGAEDDISLLPDLESPVVPADVALDLSSVYRVLAPLPARQRNAWELWYLDGRSMVEIAKILGCSSVSARRWVRKADARVATLRYSD